MTTMVQKYSIAICIPYFGKFNDLFYVWLKSAGANSTITFFIFSDDISIKYKISKYSNIRFIYLSFKDMQKLIKQKINKNAYLNTPYKLCDYKPTYGALFEDYLVGYDFWGYCDVDLVFGDIRSFITNDILENYDHIMYYGHLSLNKNNEKMKYLFKTPIINNQIRYPFVFYKHAPITIFDEDQFNKICSLKGINSFYNLNFYCDLFVEEYGFKNTRNKAITDYFVCEWKNGKLFSYQYDGTKKIEQLYIHLQKREMRISINEDDFSFIIYPNFICKITDQKISDFFVEPINKRYTSRKKRIIKGAFFNRLRRKIFYIRYRNR